MPPQFLENIVILCFERRVSKQNSVIRLKSNILPPKKILGWLRHWLAMTVFSFLCRNTAVEIIYQMLG